MSLPAPVRDAIQKASRIAFPPALGEPDLVLDLGELLGDSTAEVVIPQRTRMTPLRFGPRVRQRALFGGRTSDGSHYVPLQYRLWPQLMEEGGPLAVDVALIRVGPPNANGAHSVGPSASITSDLARLARTVIAEIDPDLPTTCGDSASIPSSALTYTVEARAPLQLPPEPVPATTESELKLARNLAPLVPDGAHVEIGVGSTAQTLAAGLGDHRGLRLHAGALSSSVQALLQTDAVDPRWRTPVAEAIGPASLMRYIDGNRALNFQSTTLLHDPCAIANHGQFVTVNGVFAVDLLGRASSEGEMRRPAGGIGGLIDFLIAARAARGGRNIIILPSRMRSGQPRVVPMLASTEVTVPRYLIDYVVTEWGVAELSGATQAECIDRLIAVAHPDDRVMLWSSMQSLFDPLNARSD